MSCGKLSWCNGSVWVQSRQDIPEGPRAETSQGKSAHSNHVIYWISRKHPLSRQRKEVQGKLTYLGGSEMTTLLNPVFFNYSQVLSLCFSIPSLPLLLPTSSRPLSIYCISFSLGLWSQHSSIATEARMPATAGAYQLACWAALSCISLAKYMQSQNGAPVAGQLRGEMRQFEGGLICTSWFGLSIIFPI